MRPDAQYNAPVRAAAILHSYRNPAMMGSFYDQRVNLFRGNTVDPSDLPDVVLVFGGDGSVHRVLSALAHSETPLLVVPVGSANDFARCLGIRNLRDAQAAWKRFLDRGDNVRSIDLGTVHPMADPPPTDKPTQPETTTLADAEGRISPPPTPLAPRIMQRNLHLAEESANEQQLIFFTGIAGLGLDAETNRRAATMPGWMRRHGGYALAALRALARYRAPRLCLHSFTPSGRETSFESPVLFAAIGNAPEYGSGMRMLPQARLDDGELDLCFVPELPRWRVLWNLPRIYTGTHLRVPEVRYLRTSQVFVESDEPLPLYADGEYLCQTPVEIAVAPRALKVIVPEP